MVWRYRSILKKLQVVDRWFWWFKWSRCQFHWMMEQIMVVTEDIGYFTGGDGFGAVRIIWGDGRSFPSTRTADE